MSQASVGFHCPECSNKGKQRVYTASTILNGSRPIVTQVLIAVNVIIYFVTAGNNRFVNQYDLFGGQSVAIPGRGVFTANGVAQGEWYRLITGGFLHANVLHLGMNMFALWILGSQLEAAVGRVQFGVVYGTSLLAGSLGVMLLSPHEATVGASGAIFGLLGLAIALQRSLGINIWQSGLGGLLLLNLAFTFGIPGISIGGHLGGLAGGLLCGIILHELGPRIRNDTVTIGLCVALGVVCFGASLVAASAFA